MKYNCKITKDRVTNSYDIYIKKYKEDNQRTYLGISTDMITRKDPNELWKLWILANCYQRITEKQSEKIFVEIINNPDNRFLFSPSMFYNEIKKSMCPKLKDFERAHTCDYNNKQDCCSNPTCKSNCVSKSVCRIFSKHPSYSRIAKTLISTTIYLGQYDLSFQNLYLSFSKNLDQKLTTYELQNVLKKISGLKKGEKIPNMFLLWLSSSLLYGIIWSLKTELLIPIDVNVRRVSKRISNFKKDEEIRKLIVDISESFEIPSRITEIAFLNAGQEWCLKNNAKCKECVFSKE